jgi:predicted dinucleotide-binding enzyme
VRIGILGTGLMGRALGGAWARRGHAVAFSYARYRARLDRVAAEAGPTARVATPAGAVAGSAEKIVEHPA